VPYVKESTIKYGLQFETKYELPINGTILVIGKVVEVFLPTDIILPHGAIDIEKAGTLAISGLDSYHITKQLSRLSYAKPNKEVEII
jgi:hypothetical protein